MRLETGHGSNSKTKHEDLSSHITPSNKAQHNWALVMQRGRYTAGVIFLAALFVLQGVSQFALNNNQEHSVITEEPEIEWVQFDLRDDVFNNAEGTYDLSITPESRTVSADSIIGIFDEEGLTLSRPVSSEWMQPRLDLMLVLISQDTNLLEARGQISEIQGLTLREFISPSGFIVQGTESSLQDLTELESVAAFHSVPLAMILESEVLDILLLQGGEEALLGERMRLEGWRGENGLEQTVSLEDGISQIKQDLDDVVTLSLDNSIKWDSGRYEGDLIESDIINMAIQPSIRSIRFNPVFEIDNDNAASHMKASNMRIYFTTDLDGSGQTVAVADSGLDEDHGDFGNRVAGNTDVINDGSTADKWSGHGTHVSCTVLGDGSRGGYSGVTPSAELYFQAMENDNTGNFQSPSLNSLLNSAYSAGARTHTNSWGSGGNLFGEYTSESQDVDDRANNYDRYYNGAEGLTILFAAGNDGPNYDTISPPATAKNAVTVGMHQSRYSGAPDYIMDGSSRGPMDDGRIKPDVLAPGGYVRSCRAQEAGDTGGASWSSTWYLEYTGTSMATPNAAGAAAMIREYLEEIALRDSPQGALVKALLILGAQDIGTRDIPNNDEGWGRVNLRNSLAPPDGQGVWVDDRSLLSGTGNLKSYTFDIDDGNDQFKAVLAWSDEYASTWSSVQLVNNLDLKVTDPNGVVYLGNDFANGRSTTGGSADSLNNVEVVLIDFADVGTWTVEIIDAGHGGSKSQPFSLAVMGHGINDLKPDLMMIESGFSINIGVPSVGEQTELICMLENTGNVKSDSFEVALEVNGVELATQSLELGGGTDRELVWSWTPQSSGQNTLSFIIDSDNVITESLETNNRQDVIINISEPGLELSSEQQVQTLLDVNQTSVSWVVDLKNTGLLPTNSSITKSTVKRVDDGTEVNWFVGLSDEYFSLQGLELKQFILTAVYSETPTPGAYRIDLIGQDLDNGLTEEYYVEMVVGKLPKIMVESDYDIIPVHPMELTSAPLYLNNFGNAEIVYDLQIQPPNGWGAHFIQGFSTTQFITSPLINSSEAATFELQITPPNVVPNAGYQTTLTVSVWSQTEPPVNWLLEIPIEVEAVKDIQVRTDTSIVNLIPDSELVMVFTVENKGNMEATLFPKFNLPQGIQVISGGNAIELDIGESEFYLITLQLSKNAKSGQATINFDNGSDRFTWSDYIEVKVYPEPSLEFQKVVYPDGNEYTATFYGSGTHPAGSELKFTWLLSNDADVDWQPVVNAVSDSKLSVICNALELIGYQESTELTCSVFTSSEVAPFSEPSFTLEFSGLGLDYSEIFTLYIGGYEELTWEGLSSNSFKEGEAKQIQILVTNTGTLSFNHKVSVSSDEGWEIEVEGNGIVNLAVGESETVKMSVEATSSGFSDLTISFDTSESSKGTEYIFRANAEEKASSSFSSGAPAVQVGLLIVIIIIIAGLCLMLLNSKSTDKQIPNIPFNVNNVVASNRPATAPVMPSMPATQVPSPAPPPSVIKEQQKPAPICWMCRGVVNGAVIGCPKCGARYHGETSEDCDMDSLEACLSCQSPSSTFVPE